MADRLFRAASSDALRIVPLDDFTAIYHRASGITHLVTAPVPEILAFLDETPLDQATLLARLGVDFELTDGDVTALAARLHELVAAGLVEAF